MQRVGTLGFLFFAVMVELSTARTTKAQVTSIAVDIDVQSTGVLEVTHNAPTLYCNNITSGTSHLTLEPVIGEVAWANRELTCGDIKVNVSQKIEVTRLTSKDGHIRPWAIDVYTRIYVSYPDGDEVEVFEESLVNTALTIERGAFRLAFLPRNVPGVRFYGVVDLFTRVN